MLAQVKALTAAILFLALVLTGASCKRESSSNPPPSPPEVTVAPAAGRPVREWTEFTGQLRAVESVEVRARVSGYLQSVHFKDGQIVSAVDLLFVIDPRPYQAVLDAALAEQARMSVSLELSGGRVARGIRSNGAGGT